MESILDNIDSDLNGGQTYPLQPNVNGNKLDNGGAVYEYSTDPGVENSGNDSHTDVDTVYTAGADPLLLDSTAMDSTIMRRAHLESIIC